MLALFLIFASNQCLTCKQQPHEHLFETSEHQATILATENLSPTHSEDLGDIFRILFQGYLSPLNLPARFEQKFMWVLLACWTCD